MSTGDNDDISLNIDVYSYRPDKVVSFTVNESSYENGAAHPNTSGKFVTRFLSRSQTNTVASSVLKRLVRENLSADLSDTAFDAESDAVDCIKRGNYAFDKTGALAITIGIPHAAGDFDYFKIPKAALVSAGVVPFNAIQIAD